MMIRQRMAAIHIDKLPRRIARRKMPIGKRPSTSINSWALELLWNQMTIKIRSRAFRLGRNHLIKEALFIKQLTLYEDSWSLGGL